MFCLHYLMLYQIHGTTTVSILRMSLKEMFVSDLWL